MLVKKTEGKAVKTGARVEKRADVFHPDASSKRNSYTNLGGKVSGAFF